MGSLNGTIIRGILDFNYGNAAKIRSSAHGILKDLTIESSNVKFSNDVSIAGNTNITGNATVNKATTVNTLKSTGGITTTSITSTTVANVNRLVVAGYGASNPAVTGSNVDGQLYFKIIS